MSLRPPTTVSLALAAALAIGLLASRTSFATLGEGPDSVTTVADSLSAKTHEIEARGTLTRHTLQAGALTVHEFVAPSLGQVVCVSWSGRRDPRNLGALLGSYMSEYIEKLAETKRLDALPSDQFHIRTPRSVIKTEHVTVERAVFTGSSHGHAYLNHLPAGVSLDACD